MGSDAVKRERNEEEGEAGRREEKMKALHPGQAACEALVRHP